MSSQKRFLLIDGHGLIYRAYHAFPPLSTKDGVLINAVYGFSRIVLTAIRDEEPEYIAVAFDHKKPTLRAQAYKEYKAHRPEMPDDLKPQIGLVKQVVETLNIPNFELEGYEADDLIGTITKQLLSEPDLKTIIVTGDKDMFQLVDDQTHVWMPARGKYGEDTEYDDQKVFEKMGVYPNQIVDLKALMGDTSDNIPGVKGIGPKTAAQLIQTYKNLDAIYARVAEVTETGDKDLLIKAGTLEKLKNDKENAYLSRDLATINREAPIIFELSPCKVTDYDKAKVVDLFNSLDFKSLIDLLPSDSFETGVQNALF